MKPISLVVFQIFFFDKIQLIFGSLLHSVESDHCSSSKYEFSTEIEDIFQSSGVKVNESRYKQCEINPHFSIGEIILKKYREKKHFDIIKGWYTYDIHFEEGGGGKGGMVR